MDGGSTSSVLYAAVSALQSKQPAPEEAQQLKHHVQGGKGFQNPWESYIERSASQLLRAILWYCPCIHTKVTTTLIRVGICIGDAYQARVTFLTLLHLPFQSVDRISLASRKTKTLRATWLGHACYYVQFPGGLSILFDPVFTHRCSPFSWLGPKRYTEVPCKIDDIPVIDAVIISHSHYDHLSYETVMDIKQKHPGVHFFAPLGNKKWFTDCKITNMTELDWWESKTIRMSSKESGKHIETDNHSTNNPEASDSSDIVGTVGCLPCQHTSGRTPFDKSRTLWASWSVESGGKKVWFGGDTGYRTVPELPAGEDDYSTSHKYPHCPAFSQIGKYRGPFDLGLIPIGAYDPRWIMSPMHANPKDAVNIFKDTRCKRALGIHWGTWVLTEEDVMEPPKLLKEALKEKDIAETGVFDVCDIGESREF